ncbi:MAG: phosphatase PAP2 family protein [Thermacetogeniaceae bacterium]
MNAYLQRGDRTVFYALNRKLHCLLLDILMRVITNLGSVGFTLALLAAFLFSRHPLTRNAGINLAIGLVSSQIIVHTVKRLVNRPRPYRTLEDAIAIHPPACKYSFPSGHTATAFVIAFILAASLPVSGAVAGVLFALAFLVAISRIYLGFHYPTDVLVGFGIAYLCFLMTINLTQSFLS